MSLRKTEMLKVFEEHVGKIRAFINETIDEPIGLMNEEVMFLAFDEFMVCLKGCLMAVFLKYEPNQEKMSDETFYTRLIDRGTKDQIMKYYRYFGKKEFYMRLLDRATNEQTKEYLTYYTEK